MQKPPVTDWIIHLSDADRTSPDLIGNKAKSLVDLVNAGFEVPPSFCISTAAHELFTRTGSISSDLMSALLGAFRKLKKPVAVRSSSPAEDRADASFAGQYQTVLGVVEEAEFISAVETCWSSAASEQARAYRAAKDVDQSTPMGVLVQELVDATAAGVLFSMHPVSYRVDVAVINANFGLGETVVGGVVEPDTFVLLKNDARLLESIVGAKERISRWNRGILEHSDTDPSNRSLPCLNAEQLALLAEAARTLEDHFDHPVDAEFAFAGQSLYMLQVRPITIGTEAYYTDLLDEWARQRKLQFDAEAIWARGSPISGLPVSPLYYSEMAAFFSDMFPEVARIRGRLPGNRKSFRYYKGYTYTDVTFSSTANPAEAIAPLSPIGKTWLTNLWLGIRYPRTYAFWCNIDAYYRLWHERWLPEIERQRPDFTSTDSASIVEFIEMIEKQRRLRSIYAALGVGYASDYLGLLTYLVQKWSPGLPEDVVGELTSGVDDSLTHFENLALWELVDLAAEHSDVRAALVEGRLDDIQECSGGAEFMRKVDAFRRERGHRGCSDRDLYKPRWGDEPSLLLTHIAGVLRLEAPVSPQQAHAKAESRRKKAEQHVLSRSNRGLFGPLKRLILKKVLVAAQRYWIQRDNQRHSFDTYFWELRCAYRALGEKLAAQGALPSPASIFFLAKTEIYSYLSGNLPGDRMFGRAAWRMNWWMAIKDDAPCSMLKGNQPYEPESGTDTSTAISATGGSPGKARGIVRIVNSLQELHRVGMGDILVTHAIDPAWTPIFGHIGGVVSEEGGLLSHATILGREYGLPVVIGATSATRKLIDGDCVEINGLTGTVTLVNPTVDENRE